MAVMHVRAEPASFDHHMEWPDLASRGSPTCSPLSSVHVNGGERRRLDRERHRIMADRGIDPITVAEAELELKRGMLTFLSTTTIFSSDWTATDPAVPKRLTTVPSTGGSAHPRMGPP
jgi:hypothetical protein